VETTLTRYDSMRQAIVEAHSIDDVKEIRDKAEALRQYARQAGESLENQNMIAEIKLRAERRAGELIGEMPKAKGAAEPEWKTRSHDVTTLSDLGISKMQSSRFQAVASLPEEIFEAHIIETKAKNMELTSAGMLRVAQEIKREHMRDQRQDTPAMPDAKYRIIYADPPWQYSNSGVITESDNYGRAARHYPTMSIDELCDMGGKVREMADSNAVLFLWATSPFLEDAFQVINAWGFQYKTSFVWDKVKHNFGHYNSVRHELLLVCTKGSCTPDVKTLHDSVVSLERSDKHSEKPEEFRQLVDSLYTWGQRIELFSRACVDGWDTWGNEPTTVQEMTTCYSS
jgi:N6-adenosine-specific RNA methylase IME4